MKSDLLDTLYTEMNDEDKKVFRDWLLGVLKMHETSITFTKKNGEVRKMRCTLNQEMMSENASEEQFAVKGSGKKISEESQAVFDLDKLAWRSFRFDSIKEIKFTLS